MEIGIRVQFFLSRCLLTRLVFGPRRSSVLGRATLCYTALRYAALLCGGLDFTAFTAFVIRLWIGNHSLESTILNLVCHLNIYTVLLEVVFVSRF
ncbi:hypothetical protein CANARDRAFT_26255 [[Candida] arabinofermentans NRRL YB-2248]|uniref:Uncharacterized protein n=1 Tax=[Candida] arabinofermentans NRRL YB-2248 TaxID=983967 RepID=A0A1E4T8L4_9ASCO|nr:hypothetical protein CANARDRAFT_26255 [[Candida] arabinofermentans NRRL YB-2248]